MRKFILLLLFITSTALLTLGCSLTDKKTGDIKNSTSVSAITNAEKEIKTDTQPVTSANVKGVLKQMDLNSYILNIISTYEIGNYPYLLNNDYENYNGVTQTLSYQGTTIAKANPDGSKSSHCVGLTFEVFYRAMQERNKDLGLPEDNFNNMTTEEMHDFLLTWYAALGTPKAEGNQLAGAIAKYGLGTQIKDLEQVKQGDFIDFSRTNNSGHTAIFINWLRDASGKIIGFKYWSTQTSTNGINYKEEYFSDYSSDANKGLVYRNQLYIGRVGSVESYKGTPQNNVK
jgi:hypothetical protein